ncbi:MAG: hypothetical protein KA109_01995 [Saprospiraceae bacterium]|jgi:tetratricopeptide (TPR) repeat protein|nr:hypothetical protein [Saprospiraceae bacterium]MBK6477846.1 hypothetical protein [Saprospiraceae bacterium]MBK7370391.1 hypothetical protein [Saprospiraceae bacterium]MBK7438099.1 hypothetical protein [Saprospiraceae bacterium]MBK7607207.1 hypothetical protein [Saprospiraceae bacterium]
MPIAKSDHLLELIHSLTKAEKRHFKLFSSRLQRQEGTQFIKLFDILEKSKDIDDDAIRKKLGNIAGVKYANLKRNLYSNLLTSLRLIHSTKKADLEIREQIDYARILYGKGLYLQSLRLFERIKSVAQNHDQNLLLLEIVEYEKLIESRHITRAHKDRSKQLLTESISLAEYISTSTELSNLKLMMHGKYVQMGHIANAKDEKIIQQFFKSNVPKINEANLNTLDLICFHQCLVYYYFILLDFQTAMEHAIKWKELCESKPYVIERDPDSYMHAIHYVLTCSYNLKLYGVFNKTLNSFEKFRANNYQRFNENSKILSFVYVHTSRFHKYFMEGKFVEGLEIIPKTLRRLDKYADKLDDHRILVVYFKIAWMYIGAGDPRTASNYLDKIIDFKSIPLREDLQGYARLLNLIAHFEMGNKGLLSYLVRSSNYFLKKSHDLNKVQKAILHFFNRLVNADSFKEKELFAAFLPELLALSDDHYEQQAFIYLDIISWVTSKIENQSLSQVISRAYQSSK